MVKMQVSLKHSGLAQGLAVLPLARRKNPKDNNGC